MNIDDLPLENLPDPFALAESCCGDAAAATGDLPDAATLEQQLQSLPTEADAGVDDLLFADLDADGFTFERELELAGLGKQPLPPLEDIISVAERYPGLKITFSF
jgi:hypothetical protein